jgi:hypothetical protein
MFFFSLMLPRHFDEHMKALITLCVCWTILGYIVNKVVLNMANCKC